MNEQEQLAYDILVNNSEFFHIDNVIYTPLRWIVWGLIKMLMGGVNALQHTILEVLDLSAITESPDIANLLKTFSGVTMSIAVFSLVLYALIRMINTRLSNQSFISSVALGLSSFMLSTVIIGQLLSVSVSVAKQLYETDPYSSDYVYQVINQNTYDLLKLSENDFDPSRGHTTLNQVSLPFFDYGAVVKDYKGDHETVFKSKIELNSSTGDTELLPLNKFNWLGIEQWYYRYKMNTFIVITSFVTTGLVYFLSSFKFIKLLFEIIFTQTLLPLFHFSDLNGAMHLKKALRNIGAAMLTIIFSALVLQTYTYVQAYIGQQNLTGMTAFVVQLSLSLAVIDGPNIIQELTGYDAGIKSTGQAMMSIAGGAIVGGKVASSVAKGGVNAIKWGANQLGKAAPYVQDIGAKAWNAMQGNDASSSLSSSDSRDQYVQDQMSSREGATPPTGTHHTPTQPAASNNQESLAAFPEKGKNAPESNSLPTVSDKQSESSLNTKGERASYRNQAIQSGSLNASEDKPLQTSTATESLPSGNHSSGEDLSHRLPVNGRHTPNNDPSAISQTATSAGLSSPVSERLQTLNRETTDVNPAVETGAELKTGTESSSLVSSNATSQQSVAQERGNAPISGTSELSQTSTAPNVVQEGRHGSISSTPGVSHTSDTSSSTTRPGTAETIQSNTRPSDTTIASHQVQTTQNMASSSTMAQARSDVSKRDDVTHSSKNRLSSNDTEEPIGDKATSPESNRQNNLMDIQSQPKHQ